MSGWLPSKSKRGFGPTWTGRAITRSHNNSRRFYRVEFGTHLAPKWPPKSASSTRLRIPMKADTCSNPYRTPFRACRTVVGAKRRAGGVIKVCPTGVKVWLRCLRSFGAPRRGDDPAVKPKAPPRRLFGRAVSGGNERSNSRSRSRRSPRATDSPGRPNRRVLDA